MAEQDFKRKLTAILSADAKGYSRLMVEDEEATVRTITAYRTAMAKLIQQYRGRVVDSPGDNVLAEFGTCRTKLGITPRAPDGVSHRHQPWRCH
jgi:adenylate cyclase